MCEKTRQKLNNLKTSKGNMTNGAKEGFNILLDEHEQNAKRMGNLERKVDDLSQRLNIMETATAETLKTSAETLKMVNEINKKLTEGEVEDKAAQMDFLQKIFSSKFGKGLIIFLLLTVVASGVAVVYLVNNYKQVTEIVESIKN